MNKHLPYGLFYIVLLPVALLIGIMVLVSLIPAFANPLLLLLISVFACFVVYTIASFIFYNKAIRQLRPYKSSLRDLIRVNAFVIIIPSIFLALQGLSIAANPNIVYTVIQQIKTMQQPMSPMSDVALAKLLIGLYYFLMVYALIIIIHIVYTFRLLKQFKPSVES